MNKPKTQTNNPKRQRRLRAVTGSAASEADDLPNEREALAAGLAIVRDYMPDGESDFDKGMRLLQGALGVKKRKPQNDKVSDGGPAASDCNQSANPPFAAPSC